MASITPLDELTRMDDCTFGVVVQDPALRRPLPEYILDIRIRAETTRRYHSPYGRMVIGGGPASPAKTTPLTDLPEITSDFRAANLQGSHFCSGRQASRRKNDCGPAAHVAGAD